MVEIRGASIDSVWGLQWGVVGPRKQTEQEETREQGISDASGLMLLHQESSHPHYTSCQFEGWIRVTNYIRILVRTLDWLLANGHFRTSTTKGRYKCDLKNKLQSPKQKRLDTFPSVKNDANQNWLCKRNYQASLCQCHCCGKTTLFSQQRQIIASALLEWFPRTWEPITYLLSLVPQAESLCPSASFSAGPTRRQKGSVCVHSLTDPSLAFLIHFKIYFGSFLRADYCVASGDSGNHPNASYLREPWNHPWLEASKIYKHFIFVYLSKKKKIATYILYIHIKGSGQIHSNYWLWIVEGTPLLLFYKRFIVWIFKVMSITFFENSF